MHFKNLDEDGRYYRIRNVNGKEYYYYADEGRFIGNLWNDISSMQANSPISSESTGYPTQKPLDLLRRIISTSSNKNDIVLDPFCGCGTAMVAANELDRRWVGIDISSFACESVMRDRFLREGFSCRVEGTPVSLNDALTMWENDPFKFESWAVSQVVGLAPNTKQVGDSGIDGRGKVAGTANVGNGLVLAQVKGGHVTVDAVRAFGHVLTQTEATAGVFITIHKKATRTMKQEAQKYKEFRIRDGVNKYPRYQFWSIEELFDQRNVNLPPMLDPMTGKAREESMYVS